METVEMLILFGGLFIYQVKYVRLYADNQALWILTQSSPISIYKDMSSHMYFIMYEKFLREKAFMVLQTFTWKISIE